MVLRPHVGFPKRHRNGAEWIGVTVSKTNQLVRWLNYYNTLIYVDSIYMNVYDSTLFMYIGISRQFIVVSCVYIIYV